MIEKPGKRISRSYMDKMRKKYKEKSNFPTQSVYFDKATFERLLAVPGVAGVRVYYGVNDGDELHPIFVPVNDKGKNIIFGDSAKAALLDDGSTIEEYGTACPPYCDDND